MATILETFAAAVEHHQAGRLPQAEQLYRQILQAAPHHPDSLHLLGVVAYQTGHADQAVPLIRRAVTLNSWEASYYSNLGLAEQAVGQMLEAEASFQKALELKPDYADAHSNLSDTLRLMGKLPEAVTHAREALRFQQNHPQAWGNLGNALLAQEKIDEAVACFHRALSINPNMAVVLNSLGNGFEQQNGLEDAVRCYEQALRLNPNYAEAHNNLGVVYKRLDKPEEAIRCSQLAVKLNPRYAEAHNNLGVVFKRQGKLDEAIRCYQEALRIKPDYAEGCSNLGNACRAQAKFDEALTWYERAIHLDASHVEAHLNLGLLWLLLGKWPQGWPEYEWRLQTKSFPRCDFRQSRWDGSSLAGRTLLLLAEQGLGDTIHFIRYVPLVQKNGGRVMVRCQPPLERLLADNLPAVDLVKQDKPLSDFDVFANLLSLPGLMGTTPASIPAEVRYLKASSKLVDHWRSQLAPLGGFKVGIAWQGSPTFIDDQLRSIPLANFASLAQVNGVRLISLQKGPGTEQLNGLADRFPVHDLGSGLDEASGAFMDTAAVMCNLDLVISSDTAIAHLAGALGVAVWVGLHLVPDWRWLLEREDTPWYPTMRLFRQTRRGHWEDVFERMATELKRMVE